MFSSVKKIGFFMAIISMMLTRFLSGQDPVCHRCEEIREYNAAHHKNVEYYEDYLKQEPEKKEVKDKTPSAKRFL